MSELFYREATLNDRRYKMLRVVPVSSVELQPLILWCFAHDNTVFTHLDGSQLCDRYTRGPCDVAEGAVVRVEVPE